MLVLATGGYARADLAPYSDLDIVIVLKDPTTHEEIVQQFVQGLWDSPYRPAQTVLAMDDLDGKLFTIPDRASSLLETRVLWGDAGLADEYERMVNALINEPVFSKYVQRKTEEFFARREKYGWVARVIEPHLKNEAGGFRDLHHVLWLERARAALHNQWKVRRQRGNMIRSFVSRLSHGHGLAEWEAEELVEAFGFLLAVREQLHERQKQSEDRLIVAEQASIASTLGYHGSERQVMIDLMRGVYQSTEKHSRFCEKFGPRFAEAEILTSPLPLSRSAHNETPAGANPPFSSTAEDLASDESAPSAKELSGINHTEIDQDSLNSGLNLSQPPSDGPDPPDLNAEVSFGHVDLSLPAIRQHASDPGALLDLLDYLADEELLLSGRTRHRLRRELHLNDGPQHDPGNWAIPLQRWFNVPSGFSRRLRLLDELDAIKLWLPEWREIAGLTTGSYYHRYTVDEHTLRALENLDHLPDTGIKGDPDSLWQDCSFRPMVYLALMLHDIAKGRGDKHSENGADIAREALTRFGMERWSDGVARLVEIHLRMEQTAFRRDFSDPAVIKTFLELVGDERTLRALYILTVCDLSAVRSGVWTSWKGRLLSELYVTTMDVLEHGLEVRKATVEQEAERVAPLLESTDHGRDRAEEFISALEVDYRRSVPAQEIASHLETVEQLQRGEFEHRWLIETHPGYVVLTLIDHDRPGLLAEITGLLTVQGIGIREARIFTRPDGVVIDRFRCEDIEPTELPLADRLNQIPERWSKLKQRELKLTDLFFRFQRRSRFERSKVARVDPGVRVQPTVEGAVVDISGADSIGLLYRLCSVLAEEGYEIRSARVTGRLDGIHDSFLIRDPEGRLANDEAQQALKQKLQEAADATLLAT